MGGSLSTWTAATRTNAAKFTGCSTPFPPRRCAGFVAQTRRTDRLPRPPTCSDWRGAFAIWHLKTNTPPTRNTYCPDSPLFPEDQEGPPSHVARGRPADREDRRGVKSCHRSLGPKWLVGVIIISAGGPYLDARNARCAVFPVDTRQALKNKRRQTSRWSSFGSFHRNAADQSVFTHIFSLFANRPLRALDASAALQKISRSVAVFTT